MSLRLPHVLILMTLILAAGVLSVRHLEADVGASSVPGLVAIEAPALDATTATALLARLPGASIQWVAADEGPLQPFDSRLAARRAGEGAATMFISAEARPADGARGAWRVLIEDPPFPAARPASQRSVLVAADYVRQQTGLRAFLLAVDPGPLRTPTLADELPELLAPLLAAADALPRSRRTSIVVLGARELAGDRRLALRLDRGAWGSRARAGLADLLDDGW
jgi:hypothetical protein